MPQFVLSPVGTSIFRNVARGDREHELLTDGANVTNEEAEKKHRKLVDTLQQRVDSVLQNANRSTLRDASAELNTLYTLNEGEGTALDSEDMHLLVGTDTLYGREAVQRVRSVLQKHGATVDIMIPNGFTAGSLRAFDEGIRRFVRQFDNYISSYQNGRYEIVFNLTGSFKSLQGYLNTLGMLYADRMVYIFQGSSALIKIPRLPIELGVEDTFESNRSLLLMLGAGYPVSSDMVSSLPEMLYEQVDGLTMFSAWGEAIWGQKKTEVLKDTLPSLPHIKYTSSFREDLDRHTSADERRRILERIAEASAQWAEDPSPRALRQNKSLHFMRLRDEGVSEDQPVYRFKIGDWRIICTAGGHGLTMHRYGSRGTIYDSL